MDVLGVEADLRARSLADPDAMLDNGRRWKVQSLFEFVIALDAQPL